MKKSDSNDSRSLPATPENKSASLLSRYLEIASLTPSKLLCPHCHEKIEIIDENWLTDHCCPCCNQHIKLIHQLHEELEQNQVAIVDNFQVLNLVGEGGFGRVYKAFDRKLDRYVALKVSRLSGSSNERGTFAKEARTLASLNHENIVKVFDTGEFQKSTYIVSEFIDGDDLAVRLDTYGRLTLSQTIKICLQIVDAISHAHQQGIMHLDLKPSNIMLGSDDKVFVTDFGLAKSVVRNSIHSTDNRIQGTPNFMSPEQMAGKRPTVASDIYAVGVIFFQLLTGALPFRGDSQSLFNQIQNESAPSPRVLVNNIPRDLETICLKCLEKEPKDRFDSANDLASELKRFQNNESLTIRPTSRATRILRWSKRNPVIAGLSTALVGLTLFAIVGLGSLWQQSNHNFGRAEKLNAFYQNIVAKLFELENKNNETDPGVLDDRYELLREITSQFALQRQNLDIKNLMLFAEAWHMRGLVENQLDRRDAAKTSFANAVNILDELIIEEPDNLNHKFNKFHGLRALQKYDEAFEVIQEVVEKDSSGNWFFRDCLADAYLFRAIGFIKVGKFDEAIESTMQGEQIARDICNEKPADLAFFERKIAQLQFARFRAYAFLDQMVEAQQSLLIAVEIARKSIQTKSNSYAFAGELLDYLVDLAAWKMMHQDFVAATSLLTEGNELSIKVVQLFHRRASSWVLRSEILAQQAMLAYMNNEKELLRATNIEIQNHFENWFLSGVARDIYAQQHAGFLLDPLLNIQVDTEKANQVLLEYGAEPPVSLMARIAMLNGKVEVARQLLKDETVEHHSGYTWTEIRRIVKQGWNDPQSMDDTNADISYSPNTLFDKSAYSIASGRSYFQAFRFKLLNEEVEAMRLLLGK